MREKKSVTFSNNETVSHYVKDKSEPEGRPVLNRQLSENSIFNIKMTESKDPEPQKIYGPEKKILNENESTVNVVSNIFQLNQLIGTKLVIDTEKLTLPEIVAELRRFNLSTLGTKKEKLDRLERHLEQKTGEVDKTSKSYQTRPIKSANWMKKREKYSYR